MHGYLTIRSSRPSSTTRSWRSSQTRFAGSHFPPALLTIRRNSSSFQLIVNGTALTPRGRRSLRTQSVSSTINSTDFHVSRSPRHSDSLRRSAGLRSGSTASSYPADLASSLVVSAWSCNSFGRSSDNRPATEATLGLAAAHRDRSRTPAPSLH